MKEPKDLDEYLIAFVRTLKGSYPGLTVDDARKAYERIKAGNKPSNIVEMAMAEDLEEREGHNVG